MRWEAGRGRGGEEANTRTRKPFNRNGTTSLIANITTTNITTTNVKNRNE